MGLQTMNQREQVAACFTGVTVDLFGDVLPIVRFP